MQHKVMDVQVRLRDYSAPLHQACPSVRRYRRSEIHYWRILQYEAVLSCGVSKDAADVSALLARQYMESIASMKTEYCVNLKG
jgi:hypothetical protein